MFRIIFLAGIILLVIGIFLFKDRIAFLKNGIVTVATVIELKETSNSDNHKSHKPVFRFVTNNKEDIIFEHNVSSNPPSWSVGEETKVVYLKDLPHKVVLLTYFGSFGATVILLSLALVCISLSIWHYRAQQFFNSL